MIYVAIAVHSCSLDNKQEKHGWLLFYKNNWECFYGHTAAMRSISAPHSK